MKLLSILLISACIVALAYGWCEPGQFQCEKGHWGCQQDDCLCLPGWRTTFPVSQNCEPICGDNQVVGNEECDGGQGCCGCQCIEGYQPYNPPQKNCQQIQPQQPPTQPPHAPPHAAPQYVPHAVPHAAPQNVPHAVPHATPHAAPQYVPHAVPHAAPQNVPHYVPHTTPHAVPHTTPHTVPQQQCQYVTVTQGGWGAECHGQNHGCYLDEHFNGCFNYNNNHIVYLGSQADSCHWISFNSAQAIQNFLPAGGRNQALTDDYQNPTNKHLAGVIAGQLLAAKLNTRFDYCDPQFSNCENNIQDLCFLTGPCKGNSVKRVIEVADYLLGNCVAYCKSHLNNDPLCNASLNTVSDCLASFNEAYDDGHNGNNLLGQCGNSGISASSETSDGSVVRGAAVCAITLAIIAAF